MNKDDLIREAHRRYASWHTMALVYGLIVGVFLWSASAIV